MKFAFLTRFYQQYLNSPQKKMAFWVLLVAVILSFFPFSEESFLVTRVIDGDTIELETGEIVRYIGVDTPETVHPEKAVECYGQEASEMNTVLVLGKQVVLEKDVSETDRYGRLLRYVWAEGVFINDYLVREGYARAVSYPPDIAYQESFQSAGEEARENNRGLWGVCDL